MVKFITHACTYSVIVQDGRFTDFLHSDTHGGKTQVEKREKTLLYRELYGEAGAQLSRNYIS